MEVKNDCIFFRGDIPCVPNKKKGYRCTCLDYKKIENTILVIKLAAIGDIIRTTPLLRKLRKIYPNSYITWLTYTPEIISDEWVDRILKVTPENIELLKNTPFDWLINLDKDPIAISLTNSVEAKKKSGFIIDEFGHAKPISSEAEYDKWLTGLFDDVNKNNTKNYVQEIFEIAGFEFSGEEYILELRKDSYTWDIDKTKKVIGLNTGCGGRWISRLWPVEHWIELSKLLINNGFEVILLGGEQENERNIEISEQSGAKYLGHYPLPVFISLMDKCDLIVSAVTMAMHLAIGLRKKVIIFNNIFNKNEFYLYNRGEIVEPDFDCDCFFTPVCPNNCMQYIYPEVVCKHIKKLIMS